MIINLESFRIVDLPMLYAIIFNAISFSNSSESSFILFSIFLNFFESWTKNKWCMQQLSVIYYQQVFFALTYFFLTFCPKIVKPLIVIEWKIVNVDPSATNYNFISRQFHENTAFSQRQIIWVSKSFCKISELL